MVTDEQLQKTHTNTHTHTQTHTGTYVCQQSECQLTRHANAFQTLSLPAILPFPRKPKVRVKFPPVPTSTPIRAAFLCMAVATFEATEAVVSVVFTTLASVKTIIIFDQLNFNYETHDYIAVTPLAQAENLKGEG